MAELSAALSRLGVPFQTRVDIVRQVERASRSILRPLLGDLSSYAKVPLEAIVPIVLTALNPGVDDNSIKVTGFGVTTDPSNNTTYAISVTLSGGNFSSLIVSVAMRSSANRTVESLDVNGNSWTQADHVENGTRCIALGAVVMSGRGGTPLTVNVTWSGSSLNCGVSLLGVTRLSSANKIDSAVSSTNPHSVPVDSLKGGIIVGTSIEASSGFSGACTWTGATKYHEDIQEDGTADFGFSSAYYRSALAEADHPLTASWTDATSGAAIAASFR